MLGNLSSTFGADSAEEEKKKKQPQPNAMVGYFQPSARIQAGANSLTQADFAEPGMMEKAGSALKGALSSKPNNDIGALYGEEVDFEDPANDELLGVIADEEEGTAVGVEERGTDWEAIMKMLGSIKDGSPKVGAPGAYRGQFRAPDPKLYQNQLMEREYQDLYSRPLYSKLV